MVTIQQFILSLSNSGIFDASEVERLSANIRPDQQNQDAHTLARDLVRQGKLTRYQAAAIYQEKGNELVLGNYLILDHLGAGGMGQVFRARHRRMDRLVALKVLPKRSLNSPDAIARFQREVKAAARLTHPNIVTAHDADEFGGTYFLVLEYVEGRDLANTVKQDGPLPVAQALDYTLQAARGLAHAHAAGIIHRDIKPSNLLLDKQGTVRILDMGLARITNPLADPAAAPGADLTQSGSIMGTVDYMAPEQALDSRQADARSDIYSLGCTLHYLLIGKPAFGGDTLMKRLTAHQQAAIPAISLLRKDVPGGVQSVFARMVAKRPAARFASMAEVIAALESIKSSPAAPIATAKPIPVLSTSAVPLANASGSKPAHAPENTLDDAIRTLNSDRPRRRQSQKRAGTPILIAGIAVLLLIGAAAFFVPQWLTATSQNIDTGQEQQTVRPTIADNAEISAASNAAAPQISPVTQSPESNATSSDKSMPLNEPGRTAEASKSRETIDMGSGKVESAPTAAAAPVSVAPASPPAQAGKPPESNRPAPAPKTVAAKTPDQTPATAIPGTKQEATSRLPVPDEEAKAQAKKLVLDVISADLAQSKSPADKVALAEKLLTQAEESRDDPVSGYVMFDEAANLSIEAGDVQLLDRILMAQATRFDLNPSSRLVAGLEQILSKNASSATAVEMVEVAIQGADRAVEEDDHDNAKRLVELAATMARRVKDPQLQKFIADAAKNIAAAKLQWDAKEKAVAKLKDSPDDANANQTVGRYYCFVGGDWDEGFAHLAKGNDPTLKELAAASLRASGDMKSWLAVADGWWDAAEKPRAKNKLELRKAARYWYEKSLPGLSGLNKTRVESRLRDLEGIASAVSSSPKRLISRLTANGLAFSATIDCMQAAKKIDFGSTTFNIQENWLLALKFSTPVWEGGGHMILYYGDGRIGHDSLWVRLNRERLEAGIGNSGADQAFSVYAKLPPQDINQWIDVAIRYNALRNELSLYINDKLSVTEKAPFVPAVDRPMPIWIGGESEEPQRFHGQVREVWLGNLH